MDLRTLEQILVKRGFVKSPECDDCQDHIEANGQKYRPALLNLSGIHRRG
ncbi:MAG: hypothetical protein HQL86_01440 [Magnetococcales bacterium]|nr:hypothetical protein [Magnetococcales bacterium]